MSIEAVAIALVMLPLALVDVSVHMDESASSRRLVMFPETLINAAVFPDLNTFAELLASLTPLSYVYAALVLYLSILETPSLVVFTQLVNIVSVLENPYVVQLSEMLTTKFVQ